MSENAVAPFFEGKPYAGNPHVWFDDEAVVMSTAESTQGALRHRRGGRVRLALAALAAAFVVSSWGYTEQRSTNNDTMNTAENIGTIGSAGVTIYGSCSVRYATQDDDYYAFTPSGSTLYYNVPIQGTSSLNKLFIAVLDSSGSVIAVLCGELTSVTQTGSLSVTANRTYYLHCTRQNNGTDVSYQVTLSSDGPKPDLLPYTPSNWASSMVLGTSSSSFGNTYSSFKDTDNIYLSWAFKCSAANISTRFYTYLYVDNTKKHEWYSDGLESGYYSSVKGYSLGKLSAGSHTIKLVTDATGVVSESNENNNTITRTITVTSDCNEETIYIRFNSGGGSGSMSTVTKRINSCSSESYTLPANQFTRANYTFAGWEVYNACEISESNPVRQPGYTIYGLCGDLTLTATWRYVQPRPGNDNFADATRIYGSSGHVTGSTVGATYQSGEPLVSYKSFATNTIWWVWTAVEDGNVTFSTENTAFDTVMGIYEGTSLYSLSAVEEDDDGGPNRTSVCTFDVVSGETYYIAVSGYGSSQGSIQLDWDIEYNTYTLVRDPNGGTYQGKTTATTVYDALKYGSTVYWEIGVPVRDGYTFDGWFTGEYGGTMVYDALGKCVAGYYWNADRRYINNDDLIVYAHWTAMPTYTLIRNPNGGTYQGKTTATTVYGALRYGSTAYWEIGVPVRDGYTFDGWFNGSSDGTMVYDALGRCVAGGYYWTSDNRYSNYGDLVVYARWTAMPKYTLTRNPNGGTYQGKTTAIVSANALTYDTGDYWSIGVPTRTGYNFTGWYTASSGGTMVYDTAGQRVAGDYWTADRHYRHAGNLTVYAQWTPTAKKYTLTRNPNGGTYQGKTSAIVSANALTYGSGDYWEIGVPTRPGYTFTGWFTATSGGVMVYDAAGKCIAGSHWDSSRHYINPGDLAVYAQWTVSGSKYTLTRNPNGGTYQGKTTAIVSANALTYGTGNYWDIGVPTCAGYAFVGWFTATSGGVMVYDSNGKCVTGDYWDSARHYVHAGNLMVYAHWVSTGLKYTLTRNPNGGTYQGKTATIVSANALTYGTGDYWEIGVPSRAGYLFLGWYAADGVQVYDSNGKCVAGGIYWDAARHYVYAGDLVVYAVWLSKSSQVVEGNNVKWKVESGESSAPLPEWAVGTFEGAVLDAEASGPAGVVSLSVAADGSVSGKMLEGGRTWTLSATALEDAGGAYRAAVTGTSGDLSFTCEVTIALDETAPCLRGVASCKATSASPAWTAWQNIWKAEPCKAVAGQFAEAPDLVTPGGVSLRFSSTGAVTAKCGGRSCSATLIPATDGTFTCFLYFPPKGGAESYAAEIRLAWDGAEFSLAE